MFCQDEVPVHNTAFVYQCFQVSFPLVCSICNEPLETCEHIEDEIYLGSVCRRIRIADINIDHSAIVENPKDRRCIITEFELSPGKIHDYITLKFLRDGDTSKSEGTKMTAVLYNMNDLDLS